MKARYPRTAGEFAEHDRHVVLRCEACGHHKAMDQQLVIFTFGEDFDLYDGYAEMQSRLSCEACGASRPAIHFYNASLKAFEPVSFEEALTSYLELRAFAQARDWNEPPHKHRGRVRKFGRR